MSATALLLALPLLFTALLTGSIALFAFRKRTQEFGERSFGLLLLAITIWTAAYFLEIVLPSRASILFWARVSYLGISTVGALFFIFAARYTQRSDWLTPRAMLALFIVPALTFFFVLTNERHGLIWAEYDLMTIAGGAATLHVSQYGLWFWLHLAVTYLQVIAAVGLYVITFLQAPKLYRRQSGIMIAGSLAPLVSNVLYVSGVFPIAGLDPTPFAFAFSGVLLAVGLFRFSLLDVNPVATQVLVDNLRDAVVVLDPGARIRDINVAAAALFNVARDKAVGRPAAEFLRGDPTERSIWDLTQQQREISFTRDGVTSWYELRISPLASVRGLNMGFVAVFHNVTREHELNQLRDDMTHMLVHDMRSPLGAIQTALQVLEADVRAAGNDRLLKSIDIARRSSNRAHRLVDNILDINQLESGRLPVNIEQVALVDLVGEVVSEMQHVATSKRIALTAEVSRQLPLTHADPELLDRILRNLLSNALRFTPEAGSVNLSAVSEEYADRVLVSVRDNGPGIHEKLEKRLFQKFATSQPGRGPGLGLAFCKLAVETMGGRIWAEPAQDSGAVFCFTLPLAE